jgi:DNA-binding beta-propeller fold protein YncE
MALLAETDHPGTTRHPPVQDRAGSTDDCAKPLLAFTGHPGGVAVGADGSLWVSNTLSGTIWKVAGDGTATPVVLGRTEFERGRDATTRVLAPAGLALAPDGSLFVADSSGHRVCAVAPDGSVRVVAGGANGYRDGPSTDAQFRNPLDVAFGPDGACYVADAGNDRIRRIAPDGSVTTVAGSIYDYGDGRGAAARFRRPAALDVDAEGTCYVADTGNNAVRRITPDGAVMTLAGAPPGGNGDGVGVGVGLRWPTGIAAGPGGVVWVADHGNGALRRIGPAGESCTSLRLAGLRWPVSVALRTDGTPVVAGAALYDVHAPEACLMVLEGAT